jgi:hypothetical protein
MLNFSYTQISGRSPIPIVNLYLQNLDNPLLTTIADCSILDTGSDLTLVSFSVISKLQAKLIAGKNLVPFKGLSREIEGIPYRIKVSQFPARGWKQGRIVSQQSGKIVI